MTLTVKKRVRIHVEGVVIEVNIYTGLLYAYHYATILPCAMHHPMITVRIAM